MIENERTSISAIADDIIKKITGTKDPFVSPIVVVHNVKVEQWFKAYYLKNCNKVMMNVRFMTLSVFVNGLLDHEGKYKVIGQTELRNYIIRAILGMKKDGNLKDAAYGFVLENDCLNGNNLYDFASKTAGLFTEYELDLLSSFEGCRWEKELYEKVTKMAEDEGCRTTKMLYESSAVKTPDSPVYVIDNSYVTPLFNKILGCCGDNVELYRIENREKSRKASFMSAPSVTREVEAVHGRICELMLEDNKIKYNDIVVYAPDITAYAGQIHRVFVQDGVNFPSIPFSIVGEAYADDDISSPLSVLADIAYKGFFTRDDFDLFVSSPVVQKTHGITAEDVGVWRRVLIETNTHRDGKPEITFSDDWDHLKKRLLTSLMVSSSSDVENIVRIGNTDIIPFSSMELDADRMNAMIGMIDGLGSWSKCFKDKKTLSSAEVSSVLSSLDKLFSRKNADGVEKNYIYSSVSSLVADIVEKLGSDGTEIPADTLIMLIRSSPASYRTYPPTMFTGGVTFLSLNCDDIVSADHIFVMGLSSDVFPRTDIGSELDVPGHTHVSSSELDAVSIKNLLACDGDICFSYVNQDLQKDEKHFPSSLMPCHDAEDEVVIPLDESRKYEKLFTARELRNKKNLVSSDVTLPISETADVSTNAASSVTDDEYGIGDFKSYLKNTFIYKYNKVLKTKEDDSQKLKDEYENIDDDKLTRHITVNRMILSDGGLSDDNKRLLQSEQKISTAEFGDKYFDLYKGKAEEVRAGISDEHKKANLGKICCKKDGKNWYFNCDHTIFRKENGSGIHYVDPVPLEDKTDIKYYFNAFIFSLADVSQRDGGEYTITVWHPEDPKTYMLTPDAARERLNAFYDQVSHTEDIKYMDYSLLDEEPGSVSELLDKISYVDNWKYFVDRESVDPYTEFGYTDKNISKEFPETARKVSSLIKELLDRSETTKEGEK